MTEAERRELHELVERYAQAVDRADGAAVAELFADDGVLALWMTPGSDEQTGEMTGHDQVASVGNSLRKYVATHHTISSHTSTVDGLHAHGETLCTAHHVEELDGVVGRVEDGHPPASAQLHDRGKPIAGQPAPGHRCRESFKSNRIGGPAKSGEARVGSH